MVALGRHVEHDPRSRQYPARRATTPRSVLWRHSAPVLDQGDLGSCTGNALAQCLNSSYFAASRPKRRYLDEHAAVDLYAVATGLDAIKGTYPPVDTGSTGLGVAKAGVQLGYLTAYQHSFGFDHFCQTLQTQPVIVGTDWHNSMFTPDQFGFVDLDGDVVGGHEYTALGVNYQQKVITFLNSWSSSWGVRGRFRMTFDVFKQLLAAQGDVTAPIGKQ